MTIRSKHSLKQLFDDASRLTSSKFYELIDSLWPRMVHPPVTLDPTSDPALSVNVVAQTVKLDLSGWSPAPAALNQVNGSLTVYTGTTTVEFASPLDETIEEVIVIERVRRASDNAVINYVIENPTNAGFDITIWDDSAVVSYIAGAAGYNDNSAYATVAYVDGLIGDIQTILESI